MMKRFNLKRDSKELGALDLASIMTGLIVIGLIGGVIAATVFAIIPWAQDEAAKAEVKNIANAQTVNQGLSLPGSVNNSLVRATEKPELETPYSTLDVLIKGGLVSAIEIEEGSTNMSTDGKVCLTIKGGDYRVWVVSNSGRHIFFTSNTISNVVINETHPKYQDYEYSETDPNTALCPGFSSTPPNAEPGDGGTPGGDENGNETPGDGDENSGSTGPVNTVGTPLTVDKTDLVTVVESHTSAGAGTMVIESTLDDSKLKIDTYSDDMTLKVKNVGAAAYGVKLKIDTNTTPYNITNITAQHGTAQAVQENGEWFILFTGTQWNNWPANTTIDFKVHFTLKTITSDNFDVTYGAVTGNDFPHNATQVVALNSKANYAANWVTRVDLSDLQAINPNGTVSVQGGGHTMTHISGNVYEVSNTNPNLALGEAGSAMSSKDVTFKLTT